MLRACERPSLDRGLGAGAVESGEAAELADFLSDPFFPLCLCVACQSLHASPGTSSPFSVGSAGPGLLSELAAGVEAVAFRSACPVLTVLLLPLHHPHASGGSGPTPQGGPWPPCLSHFPNDASPGRSCFPACLALPAQASQVDSDRCAGSALVA